MTPLEQLREWFRRDFEFPLDRVEALVDKPKVGEIRFELGNFLYTVTLDRQMGYLGCIAKDRTRPRWADLPDGEDSDATWAAIVVKISSTCA